MNRKNFLKDWTDFYESQGKTIQATELPLAGVAASRRKTASTQPHDALHG